MPVDPPSFTLFPLLPSELRNHIYAFAIEPRIVKIWSHSHNGLHPDHDRSSTPIPPLLQTCREARRALQFLGYEIAFTSGKLPDSKVQAVQTTKQGIWFNFNCDVLRPVDTWGGEIHQWENICRLPSKDRSRVQKLAVDFTAYWRMDGLAELCSMLGNVKHLLLNTPRINNYSWDPDFEWLEIESVSNLVGYLECDVPEIISPEIFLWATKLTSAFDPYERLSLQYGADIVEYQQANGGSYDGFFQLENSKMEDRLRERMQTSSKLSGTWSIPKVTQVYLVTKEHARMILAFRDMFEQERRELEWREDEEGPRQISNAPFNDDEVMELQEIEPW